jgi:hypothetical protein
MCRSKSQRERSEWYDLNIRVIAGKGRGLPRRGFKLKPKSRKLKLSHTIRLHERLWSFRVIAHNTL